jgi:hypothetical protein
MAVPELTNLARSWPVPVAKATEFLRAESEPQAGSLRQLPSAA